MLVMIVYLIALRAIRIKAEDWLDKNRHILFNHAANLKSEDELLEAILTSERLDSQLGGAQGTPTRRAVPSGMERDAGASLLNYERDSAKSEMELTPRHGKSTNRLDVNSNYEQNSPNAKKDLGPFTFDE